MKESESTRILVEITRILIDIITLVKKIRILVDLSEISHQPDSVISSRILINLTKRF